MKNFARNSLILAPLMVLATLAPVSAQPQPPALPAAPPVPPAPAVVYQGTSSARDTQQQLRELLEQYPPSLREVLQIDPTLVNRPDYLAPYPMLSAFLQQHPEVTRNPSFFFGERYFEPQQTDRQRVVREISNVLEGAAFLTGFLTVVTLIFLLLRHAVDYRKWRRHMQLQTEVHGKIFDRMTSNQELLAYIESPAGRRFFEAGGPIMAAENTPTSAPVARILWSVQIGVVVAAVGAGFWVARATVNDVDVARAFEVMGTLAVAVGIGFVLSAAASWLLSQRLGLIRGAKAEL